MTARRKLTILFVVVLIVAGGGFVAWKGVSINARIAAPKDAGRELTATMHAVGREFKEQNRWIKIVPVPAENLDGAERALAAHEVDLAILRSDQAMPLNTSVIAILRKEHMFLIAPAGSKLDSFSDLAGLTIGVLPGPARNNELLDKVLDFYNVDPAKVTRTRLEPAEAAAALKARKIAAVLVFGQPGKGLSAEIFGAATRKGGGAPTIVGSEETDALVAANRGFHKETISKGAFRGVAPDEDTEAPAVEYRIVARSDISDLEAGELARTLMSVKAHLIDESGIEAPDTEQTSYPIHPGARAYFDGDPPSLINSFESYFWLGWASIGILGTLATWLIGRLQGATIADRENLRRLILLLGEARHADEMALMRMQEDFEEIVEQLLKSSEDGTLTPDEKSTYQLALSVVRDALLRCEERIGPERRRGVALRAAGEP